MQPNEFNELLDEVLPKLQIKGLKNLHKKLKTCGLVIKKPENYSIYQAQEVQKKVESFLPEQGWLCFQNKVEYFLQDEIIPYAGILLYGEVVKLAQKESLHIREDGQGGWILTEFAETEGNDYLVETKTFLGEGKKLTPEKLYYRVYWQYDERHGYRQVAARFNGFA